MGDPTGRNPKFRSTFLTLSTLWVEKINTLQVWQGERVMSEYDTIQEHTSTAQCLGYNVLILGRTKCAVVEISLRQFSFSRSARGGFPEAQVKVFRAEDLPRARSRQGFNQVKRPPPHLGALSIYLLKVPVVLFDSDSDEHGLTPAI